MSSKSGGNCFLVYEYAENGSLDKLLYSKSSAASVSVVVLTWNQRLNIALDVANSLQHMHEHTQPSIVHRDIRTTNILLASRFKAKIANLCGKVYHKPYDAENGHFCLWSGYVGVAFRKESNGSKGEW